VATALLILVGGLVTNTGSALAVPDWPTTFGYNMFLYPWSQMTGGVFYEHSHRLLGSLAGLMTIGLAMILWNSGRAALRWMSLGAVVLVSLQGVLGGLRVVLLNDNLAVIHGPLAQAFFALTVVLVLFTAPNGRKDETAGAASTTSLKRLGVLTTGAVYLQIVLGAFLTHWGRLDAHLVGAAGLLILIPLFGVQVVRRFRGDPSLVLMARAMKVLFVIQLLLGGGAYLVRFTGVALPFESLASLALPVTHRVMGSLILGLSLALTLKLYQLDPSREESGQTFSLPHGVGTHTLSAKRLSR
jgi:cytochrome c oxidase assembly protein subunit 15